MAVFSRIIRAIVPRGQAKARRERKERILNKRAIIV
jgi:hypothetical protein